MGLYRISTWFYWKFHKSPVKSRRMNGRWLIPEEGLLKMVHLIWSERWWWLHRLLLVSPKKKTEVTPNNSVEFCPTCDWAKEQNTHQITRYKWQISAIIQQLSRAAVFDCLYRSWWLRCNFKTSDVSFSKWMKLFFRQINVVSFHKTEKPGLNWLPLPNQLPEMHLF